MDQQYAGMNVHISRHMIRMVEDWSMVRSPSRAKRRMKRGFPQRVRMVAVPGAARVGGALYVHPAIYAEMVRVSHSNSNHI